MSDQVSLEQGADQSTQEYITVIIADQLFGLPILEVQDVFMPAAVTEVPLAKRDIAGVLNLRGRIVTAIDMRKRLGLPPLEEGGRCMAVGIESNGESYGLIIDSVGEVHRVSQETFEVNPANLDPRWAAISAGVHRLDGSLMVIIDVDRVLAQDENNIAA
ncbi:MAG TPA: chemotaxis protein CheW [Rhizobiales bacterium]|nr:chemotaxis protein CheW [bacterium BMS3Bbin10]HDO51653.1 chemotaxis protein CheW [Hyphomicrobiales bacterium]